MTDGANAGDRVRLEASWKAALAAEFGKPYMQRLREFLKREKQARKVIYPRGDNIFHALDLTPLPEVKVVIIGQDPYHGPRQAHGLCFSVQPGVPLPPSLENIFKEINDDLGAPGRRLDGSRGCLDAWARQGVLLLNAVLTVERGRAAIRARVGKPSPTRSSTFSTAGATGWYSCCGGAMPNARGISSSAGVTAC